VLHLNPLIFAKSSRIFLIVFKELYSNIVPVVLSSAKPSALVVSKADSFLNLWSSASAASWSISVDGTGFGRYGRAMK